MAKMLQPRFSICIPNFNCGKYIGDTIKSVLDQTFQDFEIIIADNASTDDSIQVIESFTDPRIKLYRNRYNIGFAPNLQRVTEHATGEYLNLLSADDQMKPTALETYDRILKEAVGSSDDKVVLYSDVETFDQDGVVKAIVSRSNDGQGNKFYAPDQYKGNPTDDCWQLIPSRDILRDSVREIRSFAPFLSIVYSRKLWEAVEGYNSIRTIGPDKYFNYKILGEEPKVIYVNRVLYRYRVFESPNRWAAVRTLKQPMDDYLYTLEWSDEFLRSLGLSKKELIARFLDRVCLKAGLSIMARGNYAQAYRLLHFALASYPGYTLKRPLFFPLALLLLMGPIGLLVAKLAYPMVHKE